MAVNWRNDLIPVSKVIANAGGDPLAYMNKREPTSITILITY